MRTKFPLAVLGFSAATTGFSPRDPLKPKKSLQGPSNPLPNLPLSEPEHQSNPRTISGKERVLDDCTRKQASSMQWLFRRSTGCVLNIDWSNIDKKIDPELVKRFTDENLRIPPYYGKALVHGMGPLTEEQAQAEEPSMSVLSITLANGVSLYDLSMKMLDGQNFIDSQQPSKSVGLRVVDIGCGTGMLTKKLMAAHGDHIAHVDGVDASPYKLAKFFNSTQPDDLKKVSLHHMLGENLHALKDESVDRVLVSFVFHELPQGVSRKILSEAWRVLAPGGTVHIVDMDTKNPRIKNLGSTNVGNWLMEPYMDSYLKMDLQDMLSRLNFTDVNRIVLDSPAPIAGFVGRKPLLTSSSEASS